MSDGPEVLIVGGGLVGASLALALDRAGIAATLVESRPAASALADPARERYLALAAASVNALTALRVWPSLAAHAQSIHAVHVSRQGDFGRLLLRAERHGVGRFGAVVPASRLGQALAAALARCTRLTRLAPATLLGFADAGDGDGDGARARIATDDGERSLVAQVLVGADGADSAVRGLAGLPAPREDYGQDALVLSVGLGRDHGGVAFERFSDDGAIALLPLPGRRAGLVWTLARERAGDIQALAADARLAALQAAFGLRLGRFHAPGELVRYPLQRCLAPATVDGRVVLVGNAAQSLHPIAAQGFNLGLRDALTLAEELATAGPLASGEARSRALERHQRRRRADRERIAAASHALARWPKLRAPGLGLVRTAALAGLNLAGPLQHSLVLAAMGFGEDMPALGLEPAA
jgi:2-octaprenyl-6-methoxyphenol hydroxylase